MVQLQDRRLASAARDSALARMGRLKRLLTLSSLALAAGFTALASGATPAYNKRGGAVAATHRGASRTVVVHPKGAWPHRKRHHRKRHRSSAASAGASSGASSGAPSSAAAPAPSLQQAPAPQPAPAPAPARTQQAPAATSGGS
jgi:hypothetical protein